jgi:hypothetical protein
MLPGITGILKDRDHSMVRWSFEGAEFHLNSDNLLRPLAVGPTPVLEQLDVPEPLFDDAFLYLDQLNQ